MVRYLLFTLAYAWSKHPLILLSCIIDADLQQKVCQNAKKMNINKNPYPTDLRKKR